MEIIDQVVENNINIPNSLKERLLGKKFCFLDIETTGFNRRKNHIIIIGILYFDSNKTRVLQYFAENRNDEKDLLLKFMKFISNFEYILTFNGDAFDIPFINERFKYYGIQYKIDVKLSIDILKIVRKHKSILGLERYNLKSIERFLNINREDTISGKESVNMYEKYVKTKEQMLKDIILLHNYEDIYNLPKILKILDVIEEKRKIKIITKFFEEKVDVVLELDDFKYKNNMIQIDGSTSILQFEDEIHYRDLYTFKWYPRFGKFQLSLQVENGKLSDGSKCVYIDTALYGMSIRNINKLKYNIPNQILIVSLNGKIISDNVRLFLEYVWQEINVNRCV